ncbi:MAG: hypothetical protein GXO86_11105 [Chlorobi bacterium]|nr:hypothetical protein [Chlorobiota bacterium]
MKVREKPKVIKYLKSRQLVKPYLKAKGYIEGGLYELVDLRKRQPKSQNKFYFRITQKYRAFGYINKNNELIVTEISDHQ